MTAYYNEHDPRAAAWLEELIHAGMIAPGVVDTRSIMEVTPNELKQYTQCHFFAGIGVWSYALTNAGWRDDRPVWTGSCPCQPFSAIGKRGGLADERHLWPAFQWLIQQCKPAVIFGEQVASKDGLAWLDHVQADLENTGYANAAFDLCAAGFGAPHIRQRLYFVAERLGDTLDTGLERHSGDGDDGNEPGRVGTQPGRSITPSGNSGGPHQPGATKGYWGNADWLACTDGHLRAVEPGTFPMVAGTPERVGLLRGYGNAINAEVARAFIESYMEDLY